MSGFCKDCALATWDTTPTGRPRRQGTCSWRPQPMPVAIWSAAEGITRAIAAAQRGRPVVWRDETRPCDVFVEKQK